MLSSNRLQFAIPLKTPVSTERPTMGGKLRGHDQSRECISCRSVCTASAEASTFKIATLTPYLMCLGGLTYNIREPIRRRVVISERILSPSLLLPSKWSCSLTTRVPSGLRCKYFQRSDHPHDTEFWRPLHDDGTLLLNGSPMHSASQLVL
nr:hypothetical protein Iba_chr13bCG13820 [Ipomoea batatas]